MAEIKGTQGIVAVVDLVLSGAAVFKQAEADGKLDLADVGLLLQLVPQIGPVTANLSDIPAELKDLSTDEAEALVAHVMAKLSLDNVKAQAIAAAGLKFAAAGFELFKAVRS